MKIVTRKSIYQVNKEAKIGATCHCPACGEQFTKEHYQQAFCKTKTGTKCKDLYWNLITPTKRNNTSRISPANARWQAKQADRREMFNDFDDDQSWDAHKHD